MLSIELGQRRTAARHLERVVDGARTTYPAGNDGQGATVVVECRAGSDTMSGELFEAAVTVLSSPLGCTAAGAGCSPLSGLNRPKGHDFCAAGG